MLPLFGQVDWQPADGSDYEDLDQKLEGHSAYHDVLLQEDCCDEVGDEG